MVDRSKCNCVLHVKGIKDLSENSLYTKIKYATSCLYNSLKPDCTDAKDIDHGWNNYKKLGCVAVFLWLAHEIGLR